MSYYDEESAGLERLAEILGFCFNCFVVFCVACVSTVVFYWLAAWFI